MINYSTINTALSGLVGYRQTNDFSTTQIPSSLTGSTSGQYVTDVSGVNAELIESAMPSDYGNLSTYLTNITQQEGLNAVLDFVAQHKELTKARHLMDNIDVVKYVQHFSDKVVKSNRFVGIKITPAESDNIAVWLRAVGTQFDTTQSITLYLYESSQNTAIATTTVSVTKQNSLEWTSLTNFICNYKSSTGGTGQVFYLGYYETTISGQAIDTKLAWQCCPGTEWIGKYQRYTGITGVIFENTALNGTNLPNTKLEGISTSTFGLHLKMSVTCDITETLVNNKIILAPLVKNKIAMRIFRDYFNSNRVNRNRDIASDRATTNLAIVEEEYKKFLSSVSFDFTDIDRFCMPCQTNQIKVQTIQY